MNISYVRFTYGWQTIFHIVTNAFSLLTFNFLTDANWYFHFACSTASALPCTRASRVYFAAKSHIRSLFFLVSRLKHQRVCIWNVIHLFSFTLSKHNTHNPIRLFANDNNVSCSKCFRTFFTATKGMNWILLKLILFWSKFNWRKYIQKSSFNLWLWLF